VEPFLWFLQVFFGPSFDFDNGLYIKDTLRHLSTFRGVTPDIDGMFRVRNFSYTTSKIFLQDLSLWKTFKRRLDQDSPGLVYKTDLTITLPKDASDPFWTSTVNSFNWGTHDKSETECCEFVVTTYGGSIRDANWQATSLAIEIIRCTRKDGQLNFPQLKTYELNCPFFELGHDIHDLFRRNKPPDPVFWNEIGQRLDLKIKDSIEKESQRCITLLLRYYKVHSTFLIRISTYP
jgi:hypothetical protein